MRHMQNQKHNYNELKKQFLNNGGLIIEASNDGVSYFSRDFHYNCSNFLLFSKTEHANLKITVVENTFSITIHTQTEQVSDSLDSIWLQPTNDNSLIIHGFDIDTLGSGKVLIMDENRIPSNLILFLGLHKNNSSSISYNLFLVDTQYSHLPKYYSFEDDPFLCHLYVSQFNPAFIEESVILNSKEDSDYANW